MRVFLGGTCNGSNWRDVLIPMLNGVDYFNPVVPNWTEEAYQRELKERRECDLMLYVITPEMEGVYSIAEVVDDANTHPNKVVFCVLDNWNDKQFNEKISKSLIATGRMIRSKGVPVCKSLEAVAKLLNVKAEIESSFEDKN